MAQAQACGAEGVALIPHVAEAEMPRSMQLEALHTALDQIIPLLQAYGLVGFVEPLGFANSTLRYKEDTVAVLSEFGHPKCLAIVHDTFHHALAMHDGYFPDETAIVHISGVNDPSVPVSNLEDHHRGLIDADDRLGNVHQLRSLISRGYSGPVSFEAFAPDVHNLTDPAHALAESIAFITSQLQEEKAGAA